MLVLLLTKSSNNFSPFKNRKVYKGWFPINYQMDKPIIRFPLSKDVIEENIRCVLEDKPLTIPLKFLRKNKEFLDGIKIKKDRYCFVCKNKIENNRRDYCSDKCQKKITLKKYNNPIQRKKRNKLARNYHKRMMKESSNYNTKTRIRDRLRDALRHFSKTGKIRKSNEYLDYKSIIQTLGPCPGDRNKYHIDHIKPLCEFDFNDLSQIQKAFAPENHQWLLIKDNLKKSKTERSKK